MFSPCSTNVSCAGELNPITLQPFVQLMPPRVLRALPLNCSAPGSLQGSRGKSKVKAAGEIQVLSLLSIHCYGTSDMDAGFACC